MANTKQHFASTGGCEKQNDGRYSIRFSDNINAVSEHEIELLMSSIEQLQKLMATFLEATATDNETLN